MHKSIRSSCLYCYPTLNTLRICIMSTISNHANIIIAKQLMPQCELEFLNLLNFFFLASLTTIRAKTFKKSTIFSVFRKTGLIPYNPEIILQKIRPANGQIPPSRPVTPPPTPTPFRSICNKTP